MVTHRSALLISGELPTNTPITTSENRFSWWSSDSETAEEKAYRQAVLDSSKPHVPKAVPEQVDENAKFYPLPMNERIQAAEFAARLRAAEKAHEAEQASKQSGLQNTGSASELFAKRMERAYANRSEDKEDKKFKVANKHKLRKEAEATETARLDAEKEEEEKEKK